MQKPIHQLCLTAALAASLLAGCGGPAPLGLSQVQANKVAASATLDGLTAADVPSVVGAPIAVPMTPRRLSAPQTGGNEAVLSVSPAETVPAVEAFISGAQKTLWIEMFEFGGTYAEKLVPLLIERAHAGVEVRLLLDQAGSSGQKKGIKPFAEALKAAGVQIVFYPVRLRSDTHGDRRFNITHRKLLLADGEVAMEGGTNLGTDFDTTEQDLMVRWRGPVLADLYREFGIEWKYIGGGQLPLPQGPFAPAGNVDAKVVVTSVPEGRFEIQDSVYKAIDGAKQSILVENQYLWDDALIGHLVSALNRGVKVRAMVPGGTKEKYTLKVLNMAGVHRLVRAGAEARAFYNPAAPEAHLHTKYFSIDDNWVAAGSCNGDQRSLQDHQELDVISTEPAFVQEMRQRVFEQDWTTKSKPWFFETPPLLLRPVVNLLDWVDYLL